MTTDPSSLAGGHAASNLSAGERRDLYTRALEDQRLFDELLDEEPLRELLEDPRERRRILDALAERPRRFEFAGLSLERWFVLAAAAAVCVMAVAGTLTLLFDRPMTVSDSLARQDQGTPAGSSRPNPSLDSGGRVIPAPSQPATTAPSEPTAASATPREEPDLVTQIGAVENSRVLHANLTREATATKALSQESQTIVQFTPPRNGFIVAVSIASSGRARRIRPLDEGIAERVQAGVPVRVVLPRDSDTDRATELRVALFDRNPDAVDLSSLLSDGGASVYAMRLSDR